MEKQEDGYHVGNSWSVIVVGDLFWSVIVVGDWRVVIVIVVGTGTPDRDDEGEGNHQGLQTWYILQTKEW